jgi:hypothetical protein
MNNMNNISKLASMLAKIAASRKAGTTGAAKKAALDTALASCRAVPTTIKPAAKPAAKLVAASHTELAAISLARVAGTRATVLDRALQGLGVEVLNRVLNLSHPSNRHVVKAALQDALDAQYNAETPLPVKVVECTIHLADMFKAMKADKAAFVARMAAGRAAARARRSEAAAQ